MENKDKVFQVLDLCTQLQSSGYGDVFFSLKGHVSAVSVYTYKGGYETSKEFDIFVTSYYDGSVLEYVKGSIITMDNLIELLTNKLNNNGE